MNGENLRGWINAINDSHRTSSVSSKGLENAINSADEDVDTTEAEKILEELKQKESEDAKLRKVDYE